MKKWPLNISDTAYREKVPGKGEPGSFWEERDDRRHCGVDLYAPENTGVVSIEAGTVMETGLMTSPEILPYWNQTYYVIIENLSGLFCKYGELGKYAVQQGDRIEAGQLIGYVGTVLNCRKIDESCPPYIRKLKNKNPCMLHFELWREKPITSYEKYLGGNWFSEEKPENLLDPTEYLEYITEYGTESTTESTTESITVSSTQTESGTQKAGKKVKKGTDSGGPESKS
ncbi:M23 family metallopeptidase [Methanosarcina sp. KYL-1]|uniref:M23 family metallopeptidase n=1 Tax=Methanosarcina sp. KYL-1 TaxID=2602068 RepID=UPI00210070C6|nr:M23 family metallopeptidase [Methanosarcina sp. KYL-1]MCQ1537077.1 M23 family metallopeptidase [Methanosarcina sp. KYL-1]